MPTPYRPDEIARAVAEAVRAAGRSPARIEVTADEDTEVWVVREVGRDGAVRRMTFPFASTRGIYTPAEIGRLLAGGSWPFG